MVTSGVLFGHQTDFTPVILSEAKNPMNSPGGSFVRHRRTQDDSSLQAEVFQIDDADLEVAVDRFQVGDQV